MPKAPKQKYYAVKVGQEGPRIYESWQECKDNVSRWPGAIHKSFTSRAEAEKWLGPALQAAAASSSQTSLSAGPSRLSQPSRTSSSSREASADSSALDPINEPSSSRPRSQPMGPYPQIQLSDEQQSILQQVKSGRNVFFTGSAGTGKSVLLRAIIDLFKHRPASDLGITASTGIASVNIGGCTLHSWAGIGLGDMEEKKLAGMIAANKSMENVRRRWRKVKTLIIDEISMIDGRLFDKLDFIARYLRLDNGHRPFGGIQLVMSGDFFQLPPVPDRRDKVVIPTVFCFDSEAWRRCVGEPVTLTRVFRQRDQEFVDMLNMMRYGNMTPAASARFYALSRTVTYDDGIEPTELYPTRNEVYLANSSRLAQIDAPVYTYNSEDWPGYDADEKMISMEKMRKLLDRIMAPKAIELKASIRPLVGAQVMLIKNMRQGVLVNGSVGKVIDFKSYNEGMLTHQAILSGEDEHGSQKEVPKVIKQSSALWPVVRFTNGLECLCIPAEFTVNNVIGGTEAGRLQVPLILAWALSVHKSQGQTLERVKVDLRRTFEKGQAYVALSRATSLETLQVLNFDPSKVMAHDRVLEWQQLMEEEAEYYANYSGNEMEDAVMDY